MKKIPLLLLFAAIVLTTDMVGQDDQTYTYFSNDSITRQLDLFLPDRAGDDPTPLVVYVHGGGFAGGDRTGGHQLAHYLTGQGIACASIDYTLHARGTGFGCDVALPEKIRAIQIAASQTWQATAWLIDKQDAFNLDTSAIFLAGSSAGAETVLHAPFWDRERMQLYGRSLDSSFSYAGVIAGAGAIMDLNLITRENQVPLMLFHGDADPLVPYGTAAHHFCPPDSPGWLMLFGSQSIARHIEDLDGTCYLTTYKGGGHYYAGAHIHRDQQPVVDFIRDVLEGKRFFHYRTVETGGD
ncbi:MAG TPA: alpha/beta hydrolase [Bacteroidales bacterium]|nr:alpha/beta hydrolase [Bacteroidales bacterium]